MRILSIFGTRPEAVKMAPVVKALAAVSDIESIVCVTAQHREMLDQVLELFQIYPDFDLNLMRPNQNLADLTAAILTHLDPIIARVQPDWILVQGDTTTVMAASILGFYHHIRIGHVEAGLRTGDKWQPFPEEINRRIAGVVADLHFAPTAHSRQNLLREGVQDWRIVVTGNPAVDALHYMVSLPPPQEITTLLANLSICPGGRRLVLVTAHRRENFGKPLENICQALRHLAETYADQIELVYPVHLNPNVQEPVYRLLGGTRNITLLPPQDNLPMIHLMQHSALVLTDSGGIQEEATGLRIPALVLREVTERPEGIEAGALKLVGTDPEKIFLEAHHLLSDREAYLSMTKGENPFGDGHAAGRIVQAILDYKESE
jgi:UDP-N-acetylglucosamine 2-epimerase (non-hydrolysing)